MKKPLVSLCMIVKDESELLRACLESVKGLVDELIIVDTGSTDDTKKIALSYGANVYDFTWAYDFSSARNFAKSKQAGNGFFRLMRMKRCRKFR